MRQNNWNTTEMDKGNMNTESAKKIKKAWPYLDSVGLTGMGETFLYKEPEEIVNCVLHPLGPHSRQLKSQNPLI